VPSPTNKSSSAKTLRERRQEKRLKEILEAALSCFADKGYVSTSMEDIAEAALLSRVGLYNYFSDKASLLEALRRWKIEELQARIEAGLKTATAFQESIQAVATAMLSFLGDNRGFVRLLFTAGSLPELSADATFAALGALLTQVIQDGIASGAVRPIAPPEELAIMLVSLLFKNALKRNVLGYEPPANLQKDTELTLEIFLHGVSVPSGD
jgi:TetR/AcrR family transcriptional regulator, transcriptional repressor of aconitase